MEFVDISPPINRLKCEISHRKSNTKKMVCDLSNPKQLLEHNFLVQLFKINQYGDSVELVTEKT